MLTPQQPPHYTDDNNNINNKNHRAQSETNAEERRNETKRKNCGPIKEEKNKKQRREEQRCVLIHFCLNKRMEESGEHLLSKKLWKSWLEGGRATRTTTSLLPPPPLPQLSLPLRLGCGLQIRQVNVTMTSFLTDCRKYLECKAWRCWKG